MMNQLNKTQRLESQIYPLDQWQSSASESMSTDQSVPLQGGMCSFVQCENTNTLMQHNVPVFDETINIITTTKVPTIVDTVIANKNLSCPRSSEEEIWHIHSCRRKYEISIYEQDTAKSPGIV